VSRFECQVRHRAARWNPDLKEFELQCPQCRAQSKQSYWPLTTEFWSIYSVRKCKACLMQDDRERQRARRKDEAKRQRDVAKSREWRTRHPGYGTITVRAWRAANPERDRAQNHDRYLRRKAERAA